MGVTEVTSPECWHCRHEGWSNPSWEVSQAPGVQIPRCDCVIPVTPPNSIFDLGHFCTVKPHSPDFYTPLFLHILLEFHPIFEEFSLIGLWTFTLAKIPNYTQFLLDFLNFTIYAVAGLALSFSHVGLTF